MDEHEVDPGRVTAAFREAADGGPPPAFDHGDVVATSRRLARRRTAAVTGGALAVLLFAGVGAAVAFSGGQPEVTSAAAPAGDAAGAAPEAAAPAQGRAAPVEPAAPSAGPAAVAAAGPSAPLGPGDPDCANRQDPALRELLDAALPEVADAPQAAITMECRPGGERGVNLEVVDGTTRGRLTVEYLPPGIQRKYRLVPGGVTAPARTASGGTVWVVSSPSAVTDPPSTAPFAARLTEVAKALAPRL
jgi:hypothetical protein